MDGVLLQKLFPPTRQSLRDFLSSRQGDEVAFGHHNSRLEDPERGVVEGSFERLNLWRVHSSTVTPV